MTRSFSEGLQPFARRALDSPGTAIKGVVSEFDIIVRVQVDMAGLEGLEGQKVDNVKPVDQLVFLAGVPALRPAPEFGLRHQPSIIRGVVVLRDVFRLVVTSVATCRARA